MASAPAEPATGDPAAEAPSSRPAPANPLAEYMIDAAQRTVLFWDVLRRRSAQSAEHRAMHVPHVLSFEPELILDGREMEPPTNYLLVRIKPPPGSAIDRKKRPFIVVDPRAGHGPGIGGFKADSEIGVASRAGHPCYFIGFAPDPVPGQTIDDVLRAEEAFLEKVIELEPQAEGRPCVIGNCQAGWAVMMLAAVRPDLFGPIIVAGSPLSYWAGVRGEHPMRYMGGLLGGSWLAALASDLGHGTFPGAHLVDNFEGLNPANTYWSKSYNLWSKVDTEAERFLGFERWWGGHVDLNAEEIQWIVDQLFIGNRLATAELTTGDGRRIDLQNIRAPIVCFCSEKDNITPPAQSLGWIVDRYEKDEDILAAEQTIVYAVHKSVGHLGIFVSGSVAAKEHQEFASNIDLIDLLPPGIYEAVLIPKADITVGAEFAEGDWVVSFERRTLADVRAIVRPDPEDERRFAAVRRLSETTLGLYRTLVQPIVRATSSETQAAWLRRLRPAAWPDAMLSEDNPLMPRLAELAEQTRERRAPAAPDNPFVMMQETMSQYIVAALDGWRDARDRGLEQAFLAFYGHPMVQALAGLNASDEPPRRHPGLEPEEIALREQRLARIRAGIAEGGLHEAVIRGLMYIGMGGTAVDERRFGIVKRIRAEQGGGMPLAEFKQVLRDQYFALVLDQDAALAAIPGMLRGDRDAAAQALEMVERVASVTGAPEGEQAKRFEQVKALFGGGPAPAGRPRAVARAGS